ncbi:hypothetical protein Tco_0053534 [Tanacetum coccineum]
MSQEVLLTVMNSMSLIGESVNMDGKRKESCNLEAELLKLQNAFNDLLKKFFENNDLKAQLQDKDSTICKLKVIIKSMREKSKEENVNYDYYEIEAKNVELENSVAKLLSENERLCNEINHLKHVFKVQFDSIKKTHVRTKEQSDFLIDKVNLKSTKNEDLKAQIQDKLDLEPLAPSAKKVDVTPKKKVKKVRFAEPLTSSSNINQCASKPTGNKKNDKISRTPSRNIKNNVEAQPRKVNKKNRIAEPISDVDVKHSLLNANSEPICATCSSKKVKIVESKNANHSEPNHTWRSNATDIPSYSSLVMTGTVRFGNDHITRIMGYGDYQLGNVTISRVYYVEGLGHNLFSVGQFCDADLEVVF